MPGVLVQTLRCLRESASPDLPTCSACKGLGHVWRYGWNKCAQCNGDPELYAMERIVDQQEGGI